MCVTIEGIILQKKYFPVNLWFYKTKELPVITVPAGRYAKQNPLLMFYMQRVLPSTRQLSFFCGFTSSFSFIERYIATVTERHQRICCSWKLCNKRYSWNFNKFDQVPTARFIKSIQQAALRDVASAASIRYINNKGYVLAPICVMTANEMYSRNLSPAAKIPCVVCESFHYQIISASF